MSLFSGEIEDYASDYIEEDNTALSTEGGIFQFGKELDAYEEQAKNARYSQALNKETDEEIEKRHEREEEKKREKEAEDERKSENRKQALKDLGEGLVDAAKATGKGVKEVARIAYNLATGSNK
jgi:hypothetical protein